MAALQVGKLGEDMDRDWAGQGGEETERRGKTVLGADGK